MGVRFACHSTIGRGRPLASDLARVTDGIAASLRQFSISLSRESEQQNPPRTSRAKRSADAAAEVSALAPQTPKGIDARSLAAAPTQGFTITRVDPTPNKSARSRGSGDRPGTNASRSRIVARGAGAAGSRGRGGAFRGRGRGGAQGGVPRANKPAARGKKRRGPAVKRDREEDYDEPLNSEELAYLNSVEQGVKSPFVPTTTLGASTNKGLQWRQVQGRGD